MNRTFIYNNVPFLIHNTPIIIRYTKGSAPSSWGEKTQLHAYLKISKKVIHVLNYQHFCPAGGLSSSMTVTLADHQERVVSKQTAERKNNTNHLLLPFQTAKHTPAQYSTGHSSQTTEMTVFSPISHFWVNSRTLCVLEHLLNSCRESPVTSHLWCKISQKVAADSRILLKLDYLHRLIRPFLEAAKNIFMTTGIWYICDI